MTRLCSLILVLCLIGPAIDLLAQSRSSGPELLTYNNLIALYKNDTPEPELQNRLTRLLNTPFVDNSLGAFAVRRLTSENSIRIATWNIERGLEFDAVKAALTNDARFFRRLPATRTSSKQNLKVVDDPDIAEVLSYALQKEQFVTRVALTGEDGLAASLDPSNPPAIILLDLLLPGMTGKEICRRLRQEKSTVLTPIIVITAKAFELEGLAYLQLGANDYVVKPFAVRDVIRRIRCFMGTMSVAE